MKKTLYISTILLGLQLSNAQSTKPTIGEKIEGHFSTKNNTENLFVKLSKKGHGNPVEDGVPDEYTLLSNSKTIKALKIGCCEVILINEGDLNGDGLDEISVVQAPMNGCTYTFSTFTNVNGVWKKLFEPFMFSNECEPLSNKDLLNKVFVEKGVIYSMQTDPNDENMKLKKVEMKVLK
ncbi:hypothetical protein [Soonwooa sp.]|uniref:hypothetical protein n=1 Tax=Soonwooa sp. TaxID=1938592 RepID=UPI002625B28F|nr:hypothetical protein [Soonwooa sp.]